MSREVVGSAPADAVRTTSSPSRSRTAPCAPQPSPGAGSPGSTTGHDHDADPLPATLDTDGTASARSRPGAAGARPAPDATPSDALPSAAPPGLAPSSDGPPLPTPEPDPGGRGSPTSSGGPRRPGAADRRRRALLLLTACLAGLLLGWSGDATWRSAQAGDLRQRTAGLSVVVVDAQRTDQTPVRTSAQLLVEVTNLGLVPLAVIGAELTYDAAVVVSIDPAQFTVDPGTRRSAVLQVAVGCRSPQPLDLPPLQARTPDGGLLSVVTDGAGQALADLCDGGPEVDHVLRVPSAAREGTQLRISLSAPAGRTTEVLALRAGGVPLTAHPLPAMIEGEARTLWLDPPVSCAPAWRDTGLPQNLQVDVDIGAPATITLPVGYQLAGWLLAGPCAGAAP